MTAIRGAASPTLPGIRPATRPIWGGSIGTRRSLVLNVKIPHQDAGNRTEPPISVPICSGPYPAAAPAPAPLDEPPGVFVRSQGLRVRGWKLDRLDESMP